jgi:hypothetical protein
VNDKLKVGVGFLTLGTTTSDGADANVGVNVIKAYFSYTDGYTLNVGKIGARTPLTDGASRGTGALAIVPAGPATIVAAFLDNSSGNDVIGATNENITVAAALFKAGPADLQVWYHNVENITDNTMVQASFKAGPASIKAQYITGTHTPSGDDTGFFGVEASMKIGKAKIAAGMTTTEDGTNGKGGVVAVDADDNQLIRPNWKVNTTGQNDSSFTFVNVAVPVSAKAKLIAKYITGEGGGKDQSEMLLIANYKYAKNLNAYLKYSDVSHDDATKEVYNTRLEIKYSF